MNRHQLNIGAYCLQKNARTAKHAREIAECGIDMMVDVPYDKQLLDNLDKYGVHAIVTRVLPGWWGGDGANAGKLSSANPISKYEEAIAKYEDHPAVWGIDLGDEPSALDFPYYGKVFALARNAFKGKVLYLNLYPNYASVCQNTDEQTVNQLGTPTYAEHIEAFCRNVPSDYICYDYYLYAAGVANHYENLRIVADACHRTGRSLWIVLQVNSVYPEKWISVNQLRFQAYSAMAFGAEVITWACYTAGWWDNQVLDKDGEKTQQYEKLKTVNGEIHAFSNEYMRFRNTATGFVGFAKTAEDIQALQNTTCVDSLSTGVFQEVKPQAGKPIVVGQMTSRQSDGSFALFICAADDVQDVSNAENLVTFRCDAFKVRAVGAPLTQNADGSYSLALKSCQGALVIAE